MCCSLFLPSNVAQGTIQLTDQCELMNFINQKKCCSDGRVGSYIIMVFTHAFITSISLVRCMLHTRWQHGMYVKKLCGFC